LLHWISARDKIDNKSLKKFSYNPVYKFKGQVM
jgi:hypothetical protein